MRFRSLALAAALLVCAAPQLRAQDDWDDDDDYYDDRWDRVPTATVGVNGFFARPQGEFHQFVDEGWGGDFNFVKRLDRDGWVGLRVDASFMNYGHERQGVLLSPTIGGRVTVDLTTDNNIAFAGIGPQVQLPYGPIRPYANAFVGVSYIYTESHVEDERSYEPFASSTNFDDSSFAWGAGGGVYVPLSHGRRPVSLDLGLTYRRAGEAEYLREGDIQDNDDGSITVFPVVSRTDVLSYHVGISLGIPRH